MVEKRREIRVIIGCCIFFGIIAGIGANCRGIFYSDMAEALNVPLPRITLYVTFYGISSAVFIPICTKLFHRLPEQISLTAMVVVFAASQFLMGSVQNTYWLYALGIMQGIPGGFMTMYPIQHIVGNWFPKKRGTYLGIVAVSSGIIGMLMNPVAAGWIRAYGWRATMRIIGVITLILGTAVALFMLKKSPEAGDCNVADGRTGDRSAGDESLDAEHHIDGRNLAFYVCIVLLVDVLMAFPQILPSFSRAAGHDGIFGSMLVSAAMCGNIACKTILGPLNDYLGARKTTMIGAMAMALSALLFAIAKAKWILCAAAFLSGSILAIYAIQFPLLFRTMCSSREFDRYYSLICSLNIMVGSFSASILTSIYQRTGSYLPAMVFCFAAMLACCAICGAAFKVKNRGTKG